MARDPKAEVEISAHSRGLGAKLRRARAQFGQFGAELKKNVFGKDLSKGFWGKAGASMVGNVGARGFGVAAGMIADVGRQTFAFEDRLNRLQIAANKTPEEMRAFANAARATSSELGVSAESILAGAQAYVRLTGDMDGAIAKQRTFARVAVATGSDITEIAETAAALKQNLKISDSDTEAAFSALAIQGKEGAIEIEQLAGQLMNIAPLWEKFKGGGGMQGLKELGAALQVGKGGFGRDAAETITGGRAFLISLQQNGRKIEKAIGKGKLFDVDKATGKKSMRNVLDIVDAIGNSKLAKDPTLLVKAFGSQEAYRFYQQVSENRAAINDLIARAGDAGVIQRDAQTRLESAAGRTQRAFEQAKNKIAEAFTPERIELFAKALAKAVELGATLVGFIGTIADKVEDIVAGPEKEARAAVEQRFAAAQKMTPEQKGLEAQGMLEAAAEFEQRGHKGGTAGRYQDAWVAAAQKRGFELQQQALKEGDVWGKGMKPRAETPGGTAKLSPEQATKILLGDLKYEIASAIRDGFNRIDTQPVSVKVDGNEIARGQRNARRNGSRPGG